MTTRYLTLQEKARGLRCKLTKVRPTWHTVKASYYIHLPDGQRVIPAQNLESVERLLNGEKKIQGK